MEGVKIMWTVHHFAKLADRGGPKLLCFSRGLRRIVDQHAMQEAVRARVREVIANQPEDSSSVRLTCTKRLPSNDLSHLILRALLCLS